MYTLSYVTKTAFDGIRDCLGCCNQSLSTLKTHISAFEEEAKEKDEKISSQDEKLSSLSDEVHDLKERNGELAGDFDLLHTQAYRVEKEHYVKI